MSACEACLPRPVAVNLQLPWLTAPPLPLSADASREEEEEVCGEGASGDDVKVCGGLVEVLRLHPQLQARVAEVVATLARHSE